MDLDERVAVRPLNLWPCRGGRPGRRSSASLGTPQPRDVSRNGTPTPFPKPPYPSLLTPDERGLWTVRLLRTGSQAHGGGALTSVRGSGSSLQPMVALNERGERRDIDDLAETGRWPGTGSARSLLQACTRSATG